MGVVMERSGPTLLGVVLLAVLVALTFGNILYGLVQGELLMPAGRGKGIGIVSRAAHPRQFWFLMMVLPMLAAWLGVTAHRQIRRLRGAGRL
jgi:hypothetical protein